MKVKTRVTFIVVLLIIGTNILGQTTMKRGRNEGTMTIPASNSIGNGNITVYAGGTGDYGAIGSSADPTLGICIGISDIIQMSGKMAFTDFKGLGTSELHLQLTTPENDRLRFFGCALSGDLYLTTAIDTINATAASGKPDYNSYMLPSGIIDLDWLALYKAFPLKTYAAAGMVDEPDLLFRYDQLSIKTGFEWKQFMNSAFVDIGVGLYKEKSSGAFAGDKNYAQQVFWFEPGVRYRFFGAVSLLGSVQITAYRVLKYADPLPTSLFRATAVMDVPLLFKETNTEAIRTLVFMEHEKELKVDNIARNIEQGKHVDGGKLDKELNSIDMNAEIPDADKEKEALQKREDIQQKLDDLEKLLDETQ